MATVEQCAHALQELADRLAKNESSRRRLGFDRTLSCTFRDLGVVFAGRLKDGRLLDIAPATSKDAQVRLTMNSDDLLAMVDGHLKMATAWATGRLRIDASVRDMLSMRKFF